MLKGEPCSRKTCNIKIYFVADDCFQTEGIEIATIDENRFTIADKEGFSWIKDTRKYKKKYKS